MNGLTRAALPLIAAVAMAAPAHAGTPKIGQLAPDFQLKLMDGSTVKLSELRGQVVVLNFWATWCVPCRQELPLLDSYYRVQRSHGLRVFAVATQDSLPVYVMKPLFAAMTISPVRSIKGPYATIDAVPTNYVIDRAGVLRYAKAAAFSLDDLNTTIVPLLKEAPVAPGSAG